MTSPSDAGAMPPGDRGARPGVGRRCGKLVGQDVPTPDPRHLSIPEAVAAGQRIGARQSFPTHLTHDTPHAELAARLPAGIAPAYDGLVIEVGAV